MYTIKQECSTNEKASELINILKPGYAGNEYSGEFYINDFNIMPNNFNLSTEKAQCLYVKIEGLTYIYDLNEEELLRFCKSLVNDFSNTLLIK